MSTKTSAVTHFLIVATERTACGQPRFSVIRYSNRLPKVDCQQCLAKLPQGAN